MPPVRSVIRPCLIFFFTIQTLKGYAVANPTMTPSDITPQKTNSSGSMARMSRPIIRKLIVGAMPAIMAFMLMNSGMKLLRTFSQYVPPIIFFMNRDWKMKRPNENPATYSTIRSIHIGRPMSAVTAAARMIPVASPATQWMVLPIPCFHSGDVNCSCSPGRGSLSAST